MLLQERLKIVALHGRAAVKALKLVATFVTQRIKLLLFLDALRHDFHRQAMRHGDDRTRDCKVIAVMRKVFHKCAINFEDIDRQFFQVRERGIAGTEVVDGQAYTERAK